MIKALDISLLLFTSIIFGYGLQKRFRLFRIGKNDARSDKMGFRIKSFLLDGILHRKTLKDIYPGLLHLFLFLGFLVPFVIIVIVQFKFSLPPFIAKPLSLTLDAIAFFGLGAVTLAFYRRYITRPSRLDNQKDDFIALALLFLIFSTGLLMEGLRLSIIGKDIHAWAPLGRLTSYFIELLGLDLSSRGFFASLVFRLHFDQSG